MRKITIVLLLAAIIAAFSCGCGQKDSGSIVGSWARAIETDTTPADVMITFNGDGTFFFALLEEAAGHNDTPGRYEISGNKITFTDDDCGNSGVYSFTIANNRLSLTMDNDSCDDRSAVLADTWERK